MGISRWHFPSKVTGSLVVTLAVSALLVLGCLTLLLAAGLQSGLPVPLLIGDGNTASSVDWGGWRYTVYPWLLFGLTALGGVTLFGAIAVHRAGAEQVAQGRLQKADRALSVMLEENDALLAEIHHRVKNNMQVVVNLLHLESARLTDTGARRRFDALGRRIALIGRVHERIYASDTFCRMDLAAHIAEHCRELAACLGRPEAEVVAEPLSCGLDTALPLALIAHELVSHAMAKGGATAFTEVSLMHRGGAVELRVVNGDSEGPLADLEFALVDVLAEQIGAEVDYGDRGGFSARLVMPQSLFICP